MKAFCGPTDFGNGVLLIGLKNRKGGFFDPKKTLQCSDIHIEFRIFYAYSR